MGNEHANSLFYNSLPAQMTTTIGRTQQIEAVVALLQRSDVRLLTLIGPGGVGKTRLALEIAQTSKPAFQDGIVFVSLAPLRDHSLVLLAIAQALSIANPTSQSLSRLLGSYLREKKLLLILDNFEHVLAAGDQIAEILTAAPHLKVLATSREVLHLYGEHEFEVPPLDLPDMQQTSFEQLPASLALFVERAQAAQPNFKLTSENRRYVEEICVQLDGLPLAIELAAARCKLLSPQMLLNRLQKRLSILTGGARNLPMRHQTLRNTLDWSYHLLTKEEQRFFCRLGVFTGTWTLEAAEVITKQDDENNDAFGLLFSLVDKSLVRPLSTSSDEIRFQLLETIREYVLERLEEHGELQETQYKYALFYTQLAEQAGPHLISEAQHTWLTILDGEAANLWQVMRWIIQQNKAALGLRFAGSLIEYLQLRSSFSEVRTWLEQILNLDGAYELSDQRAKVAYGAAMLALKQNHLTIAQKHVEESRMLASEVGDKRFLALSMGLLAFVQLEQGNYEQAYTLARNGLRTLEQTDDIWARGIIHSMCGIAASRKCDFTHAHVHYKVSLTLLRRAKDVHREAEVLVNVATMTRQRGKLITAHFLYKKALALHKQIEDRWGQVICWYGIGNVLRLQGHFAEAEQSLNTCLQLAVTLDAGREQIMTLWELGQCALHQQDFEQAKHLFKKSLHLSRELDYIVGLAYSLQGLADVAIACENIQDAKEYYEQSQQLIRKIGDKMLLVSNLCGLGRVALMQKKAQEANTCFRQAIQIAHESGDMLGLTTAIGAFARLCGRINLVERSAQFLSTADALRQSLNASHIVIYHSEYEQDEAWLKTNIGNEAFRENWMVGQTMTLNHTLGMMAQIHVPDLDQSKQNAHPHSYPANLTSREVDVLRLVSQGLTDVLIAKQLVLSPRTVNTHLRSIYAKLGVSSRSAATRFALEKNIL
jgi:predicted ATPase/DNA-binding CsgD family transcriptional regulator/Tfp pilus assembly protein PilF